MKKYLVLLLFVVGCENSYQEHQFPVLPDGLKDCKFFHVQNESGLGINVVRCNQDVSVNYREGKTSKDVALIQ